MKRNKEENGEQNRYTLKAAQAKNSIGSIDLEDKLELERREAYIEPQTREILRTFLNSEDQVELVPVYRSGAGYTYELPDPASEKFNSYVSKEHLLNLARLDILTKRFYDAASACPKCASINLTMHSRCPICKSHNIEKTSLTEHILCGYIDQRNKYIDDRCPKCGEVLSEGQTRNMGRWYVCKACNDKFENPELDVICHICNKSFALKEAQILEVPKFALNPSRIKEIRQNVASLEDIRRLLANLGFAITMPGLTIGEKSGIEHHFSLIATRYIDQKQIMIALDHAVSEIEVQTSPLILYIYKTSEVKVDIPIFVAMPKLNDTAKRIAQGHQILLVEGSTDNPETIKQIQQNIESRIFELIPSSEPLEDEKLKNQEKRSIFTKAKQKISILA